MGPEKALPLPDQFSDVDAYVDSLLAFGSSSCLLQTLCGGVHILDFFTRSPDLYSVVLPLEWREWVKSQDMMDFLDLLMREDLRKFNLQEASNDTEGAKEGSWRGGLLPPQSLIQYIRDVRRHSLKRDFQAVIPSNKAPKSSEPSIARHIAVGMKVKKVHEVDNFARYVDKLTADIAVARDRNTTHVVDFGSGQNYLGRALASEPYNKHIIAVESKPHNIEGARTMDIRAKLAPKVQIMRNKKVYRAGFGTETPSEERNNTRDASLRTKDICSNGYFASNKERTNGTLEKEDNQTTGESGTFTPTRTEGAGSIQYVVQRLTDGDLAPVMSQIFERPDLKPCRPEPPPSTAPLAKTASMPASKNR